MITRSLNHAGVYLGKDLDMNTMGEQFNPSGYWEHKRIILRQQQLLKALSKSWDAIQPLPDNWLKYRAVMPYKVRLKEIVKNEFAGKKLWGWKDPRSCLLIPMWQELLQDLDIDLSYVVAVRNPLDVAASLKFRNSFSKKKSFDIWCLYTLSALIGSDQSNRVMIHSDQFLKNWESIMNDVIHTLDLPFPDSTSFQESMNAFINPQLQHSHSSLDDLQKEKDASNVTVSLYKLLLRAEKSPGLLDSDYFRFQIQSMYKELYG
jgi:hypothetical protein